MTDSAPLLVAAAAVVLLLLAPAVAVFFGGVPARRDSTVLGLVAAATVVVATGEWMLLGQPASIALFQGAIAAIPVMAIAAIGLHTMHRVALFVFLGLWLVAVVVPVGFAVFDIERGYLASVVGTLDFAGASVLGIVPATAAIALAVIRPTSTAALVLSRPRGVLAACAVACVAGFTAVSVGAQLVIDETTEGLVRNTIIAAAGGAVGWVAAQVANVHRATVAGVVAGIIAGSLSALPASPWLEPVAVGVLSAIAGLLGHLITIPVRSTRGRPWSTIIGVCLVPASVGVVGAGIVADGQGLLYSGRSDLAEAQLRGLGIVLADSLATAAILVLIAKGAVLAVNVSASRRSAGTPH